jgi:hypothetical protein
MGKRVAAEQNREYKREGVEMETGSRYRVVRGSIDAAEAVDEAARRWGAGEAEKRLCVCEMPKGTTADEAGSHFMGHAASRWASFAM